MISNPKLLGSPFIDAVPQSGKCPFNCRACYFNHNFYRETPFIPTLAEAEGKIVRVCSGNDANNQRDLVLDETRIFPNRYYCTSQPVFSFGAPVEFTCNPEEEKPPLLVEDDDGIMLVRFRYAPWRARYLQQAIDHYCVKFALPLLVTPMRYLNQNDIASEWRPQYHLQQHILNDYYMAESTLLHRWWGHPLAILCAGLCRDCLVCVHFYYQAVERCGLRG